jgi:protein TonB
MGILTGASAAPMPTPEMPTGTPAPAPSTAVGPGVVSSGWLAANSVYDQGDPAFRKRARNAQLTSLGVHGVLVVLFLISITRAVIETAEEVPPMKFDIIYLQTPGPGGGGGGSPKPAPAKKLELPKPTIVPPPPVAPTPVPTVAPPPPSLTAPVMTNTADLLQAQGVTGLSPVPQGGGGRGTGIGTGDGSGLGPGTGGGFGGGAYRPGNGIDNPIRIREVKPQYTPEAMRAKIQGTVELEAVIGPDGKVTDVRVTRSLDRVFGLDEQAKKAVMSTPFLPGKKDGKPVAVLVVFELQFTLR